jgi:hypothetical protein
MMSDLSFVFRAAAASVLGGATMLAVLWFTQVPPATPMPEGHVVAVQAATR